MNIVYIHGNHATSSCFNYIRSQLPQKNEVMMEYDSATGFYNNHDRMLEQLQELDDLFFIAHSLGGIHALHLANELAEQTLGGVTLSTPYGGSEAATVARLVLPFTQVLNDIHPLSGPVLKGKAFKMLHPWTNVVSINGSSPFMLVPNDGVVTQESMRHRSDITLVDVDSNHFEVLLSTETVSIIKQMMVDLETEIPPQIRSASLAAFSRPCPF